MNTPSIEEDDAEKPRFIVKSEDRCYAMAYSCRTWEAFRSGECGFCDDDDVRCVFTGLYLGREMTNLERSSKTRKASSKGFGFVSRSIRSLGRIVRDQDEASPTDDDRFNEVSYNQNEDDTSDVARSLKRQEVSERASRGQHFIKTAAQAPTCLYHYQIVIATNASDNGKASRFLSAMKEGKQHYFYLQIPLNQSGAALVDLDGTRKRDRLIQVSHLLKSGSRQHAELAGDPFERLQKEYSRASNSRLTKIEPKQLDFYTALITFKSAPLEQESGSCNEAALAEKTGAWYLCRPLRRMEEARIWASNRQQLERVQWVALNYMSGLKQAARLKRSHLLVRDPEWGIQSANEMAASMRPTIAELSPTSGKKGRSMSFNPRELLNSPAKALEGLLKPLDCLGSSLNPLESGGSASNLKCGLTKTELKYSARLRPIKANSKS